MKNKILSILKNTHEISGYKLIISKERSSEMFFIKDELDMNRSKDVEYFSVTVYKDFEEGGKKYRGSAGVKLSPETSEDEIQAKIADAAFAAGFVKNSWYPLAKPSHEKPAQIRSSFDTANLNEELVKIKNAIYVNHDSKAEINSSEIFINTFEVEIINSEGVDVTFKNFKGEIEVITNCSIGKEDVELYGTNLFASECVDMIQTSVKNQLQETQERAVAEKAPHIKAVNVILTGASLKSFFEFYYSQAAALSVYNKSSRAEIGKDFQGADTRGSRISITLLPDLHNSAFSSPYDNDGLFLKQHEIYKDGIVTTYHGSTRFASYLNVEPTGSISNFEVAAGDTPYSNFQKEPYVEILIFSDFFIDVITGDFGGEFRLARYFDGKTLRLIHNGSISGNMFQVQKEFYFSKETFQYLYYKGPKGVLIPGMEVLGE